MHAEWKYTNKSYHHMVQLGSNEFEDVFAERRIANTVQVLSLVAGVGREVFG